VVRAGTRRAGAARGFTIIELVVALAIGGVVAVTAYALLGLVADTAARVRDENRLGQAGLAARRTIEGWLRSATVAGGLEPFVGTRGEGIPRRDALTFAVTEGGLLCPGPCRVRLWIDRDPHTRASGLVAELNSLSGVPTAPDTVEIAGGAGGLIVRYRARVADPRSWSSEWVAANALPAVVELRVTSASGAERGDVFPALLAEPIHAVLDWEGR
jgi:prepilin-type N-terminal cleavage/methylation domain-containing protein